MRYFWYDLQGSIYRHDGTDTEHYDKDIRKWIPAKCGVYVLEHSACFDNISEEKVSAYLMILELKM